jgi:hypothetical protein
MGMIPHEAQTMRSSTMNATTTTTKTTRPVEPDTHALELAAVIVGKRIESDHRDYNALLGRLRESGKPVELAFYGPDSATAHSVVEAAVDANLRSVPTQRIVNRIASLERRRCASVSADIARFDPSRLGGRGAAGRQRDRARSSENRQMLAARIHRLATEIQRREQLGGAGEGAQQ